ncbi:MAG: hypothetical protein JWN73_4332 [Betaproteobacteria bacterium]|nr:hypothetical protein [Betaproteobacteria bacterium]
MDYARITRHLLMTRLQVRRAFPATALFAIEQAIAAAEAAHQGELRFVVEGALSGSPLYQGESARERAIDLFSHLRMWDTDGRNGVLIYLLLADRAVEIVADRGVDAHAGDNAWQEICRAMQAAFSGGQYEAGALAGVQAVAAMLTAHFPGQGPRENELSNQVVLL